MRKLFPVALLTLLAPLLALATLVLQYGTGTAQGPVELGTDTDPAGNTATSLGPRDACVSVDTGDTFEFDIFVSDVEELVHWELYLKFDPSIIEVVDRDMRMFLSSEPGSSLKTQWVPYSDGRHFLGAADLRDAPETGSGVLARLTLRAKAPGISAAEFPYRDVDGDGDMDIGPRLTGSGGIAIGDDTGDGVFDDQPPEALIAVDEACEPAPPTPTSTPTPMPTPTPAPDGDTPPSPTDTSPPSDILPVPGDPTFEPPPDTPPPTDDNGPESEDGEDSTPEGEPEGPSEAGPDDEEVEGSATDGSGEEDGAGDSEDGSAAAVLAGEGTPVVGESADDSGSAAGGDISPSASSDGGFPLWAIGSIAVAVLVPAAGASVFLTARARGRFGR